MRKTVTAISLALVLLLLAPLVCEVAVSHYRRWQASKLLATLRDLHPGATTEVQARAALKPFSRYGQPFEQDRDGIKVHKVDYQFYNLPEWIGSLLRPLNLPFRIGLPWTFVEVELAYMDSSLAEIRIIEMQEDQPGYPHPNSASVSIYATQFEALPNGTHGRLPENFQGYWEYSRSSGSLDEKGNLTGFTCCHARFVELDERATSTQREQSLNFQLHCLTSILRCKDDRQLLP